MKGITITALIATVSLPALAIPPSAPSGISARSTSNGYVEINWSRATDSDGTIEGYELIRNNETMFVGNVTQYIDNNISFGISYTYRVIAVDNTYERSTSNSSVTVTVSNSGSSVSVGSSQHQTSGHSDFGDAVQVSTSTATACIDTDGDGWGWDGYESCIAEQQTITSTTTTSSTCIDSDGDGWGWDGSESCIATRQLTTSTSATSSACADTDGDRWDESGKCETQLDNILHAVDCIDIYGTGSSWSWSWGGTSTDACIR